MKEKSVPPYHRNPPMYPGSLWNIRCDEIDSAADLMDAEGFIQVAAAELQRNTETDPLAFFNAPSKRQLKEGICPMYAGHINCGGADSTILCKVCEKQLHLYVETKFCEQGRNIYCPIWQAENNTFCASQKVGGR